MTLGAACATCSLTSGSRVNQPRQLRSRRRVSPVPAAAAASVTASSTRAVRRYSGSAGLSGRKARCAQFSGMPRAKPHSIQAETQIWCAAPGPVPRRVANAPMVATATIFSMLLRKIGPAYSAKGAKSPSAGALMGRGQSPRCRKRVTTKPIAAAEAVSVATAAPRVPKRPQSSMSPTTLTTNATIVEKNGVSASLSARQNWFAISRVRPTNMHAARTRRYATAGGTISPPAPKSRTAGAAESTSRAPTAAPAAEAKTSACERMCARGVPAGGRPSNASVAWPRNESEKDVQS
mmetsp:Transcript_80013/g.226431  ORF Transcript_80013/g.226431 Transcript_80013/m.226431 type:complete len:293 (-) Transcript_80013:231-1109(-)